MLILESDIESPSGLSFSPDGQALVAAGDSRVQVWPRWLDAPPRPAVAVQSTLERFALSEDASRVYLYVSGNSYTRVLNAATGEESGTKLPSGGPSWFHFDTAGGFFLVSHNQGRLSRFNHAPQSKKGVRKAWSIERPTEGDEDEGATVLGSHYRFGAICAAAGVFVALEYRYGRHEPYDGVAVRSVRDGSLIYRKPVTEKTGRMLRDVAGLTLAIHPSGKFFAYPHGDHVRLWPLESGIKLPKKLTPGSKGGCRAVAFHPSGSVLAAVGEGVALYDTATWQVARTLEWGVGDLRAVCFTPDGTRAAAVAGGSEKRDRKVVVWDVDA